MHQVVQCNVFHSFVQIFYSVLELAFSITYLQILYIVMPEIVEHYVAGGW